MSKRDQGLPYTARCSGCGCEYTGLHGERWVDGRLRTTCGNCGPDTGLRASLSRFGSPEVEQRWTIYLCPGCGVFYNGPGGCGPCEPSPRKGHPRPVLERVEVVPASALAHERQRREALEQALVDIAGWENWQRPTWREIAQQLSQSEKESE